MDVLNWQWDDPRVAQADQLLRRVPRKPSCLILDPLTEEHQLKVEAFTYDKLPDVNLVEAGLSVSIESVANSHELTVDQIFDWELYGGATFSVALVRTDDSGVIGSPVPSDPSHGLVRVSAIDNSGRRKIWLPLRSRIRDAAIYHDSPKSAQAEFGPARTAR